MESWLIATSAVGFAILVSAAKMATAWFWRRHRSVPDRRPTWPEIESMKKDFAVIFWSIYSLLMLYVTGTVMMYARALLSRPPAFSLGVCAYFGCLCVVLAFFWAGNFAQQISQAMIAAARRAKKRRLRPHNA